MEFQISSDPIEDDQLNTRVTGLNAAIVTFDGRVRSVNEGQEVERLEYEAFGDLAIPVGRAVLAKAMERFEVLDARAVHRTGMLEIGDVAIRVVVEAQHRKAAFEACDWIVDELKRQLPVWKKEHYRSGVSDWLQPPVASASDPAEFYRRQIALPEVGLSGQATLEKAKVLVIGAGGLGASCLPYLAAAGVGSLLIVDEDVVEESNLHRQPLFRYDEIGVAKAQSAAARLRKQNPHISVRSLCQRFTADFAEHDFDLIIDCTDNLQSKFALTRFAREHKIPLLTAAIYKFEGHLQLVSSEGGCLACGAEAQPVDGCVGNCAEVGVLGAVPAVFGSLQAVEALKLLLGLEGHMKGGDVLIFDLLSFQSSKLHVRRNLDCPVCGEQLGERIDVEVSEVDDAWLPIDIREADEIAADPLEIHRMSMSSFDSRLLPRSDSYLLVCASGGRSSKLALRLREEGDLRFYSLIGGAKAWKKRRR